MAANVLRPQALFRRVAASAFVATPSSMSSNAIRASSKFTSSIIRPQAPAVARVAAFHASARRDILPPLPQRLEGTANEAAAVPPPHPSEGGYHWAFERAVSVLIIPLTVAPFVGGSMNPVLDATLGGLLIIHSHMGFQACITDYFPKKRVPKTRKTLEWSLLGASVLGAYGLWELETNDVGLTETIKRVWKA